MARLEHIRQRLEEWAIWKTRDEAGARGYASSSVLNSITTCYSRGSYNGMLIPVFEERSAETDQAVESLKLTRSHLYATLDYIYLKELGIPMTALKMRRAQSTIKAQLESADHAIAEFLENKATEAEKRRVMAAYERRKGSFTP
ncbi:MULTISPECIES: hypothetical protein [unclassified Acidovorax]|uniref:hypothetical protein n=1 Tax=unclassified Acidovorax TaxID=2684926 RepID=UPI001C46FEDD|nr:MULTISPECIES: hypothetical protein [unclassified Acidovorax]MBV7427290.1 hypothetical protein [Acidovorax sp. sif0732]MBV7448414.1 hypothetical protein [Acidovorax sp. sif0715]